MWTPFRPSRRNPLRFGTANSIPESLDLKGDGGRSPYRERFDAKNCLYWLLGRHFGVGMLP